MALSGAARKKIALHPYPTMCETALSRMQSNDFFGKKHRYVEEQQSVYRLFAQ